ncbi:MAG: hypothetical protein IPP97_26530 [Candidatus Obscuribacter sp.]|nr:hypothetical protein [Candidatus Obscuribacter sp.]MBP6348458.1 hypothetical protein [Candidatus Obscuribacter sp.]MBP6592385.1 hypothetical protein [Candidatus Obscuribacter sp.]MBP7575263.1 hypothetical protein [Candidatus Obscuribacter sp.]
MSIERKLPKSRQRLNTAINLTAAIGLALTSMPLAVLPSAQAKSKAQTAEALEIRTIQCPTKQSVGTIVLTTKTAIDGLHDITGSLLHEGRGTFTVKVPKDSVLALIVNSYGAHNSTELATIKGIDALKVQMLDMDSDDGNKSSKHETLTDKALINICKIQSLRYLDVARSDVSDIGLKNIAALSNLEQLTLFATDVTGESFAELTKLPKLQVLDAGACRLLMSNLRFLPNCKTLRVLRIDSVALTREGAQYISQCPDLVELAMPHSNSVTDYVIAPLVQLKSLKKLDLRQTKVTTKGISKLSVLHLERLELPGTTPYTKAEMAMFKQWFPKTDIVVHGGPVVDDETKQIFAPLSQKRGL